MELSLDHTAELLGKARRQVLYLIDQGRLPAKKVGGRWVIDCADLPSDAAIQQRASQKHARLQDVIEDALTPSKTRAMPCATSKRCRLPRRFTVN